MSTGQIPKPRKKKGRHLSSDTAPIHSSHEARPNQAIPGSLWIRRDHVARRQTAPPIFSFRCERGGRPFPEGVTSGERMHKARHTAGQRLLDATGNLKAVQKLLGHESIQTTGAIYTDWDAEQLAESLLEAVQDE